MARTVAGLPEGTRVTDFISLGVLSARIPLKKVQEVLAQTGRASQRQRNLPAHVMVYYVIALALYMEVSYGEVLRCLLEGLEWLGMEVRRIRRTGRSAISQARARLGVEPLRKLYDDVVEPIATPQTKGAWYRRWRLVSIDGTTLHTADTHDNEKAFGRPGASRGRSGFPQIRLVCLVENGTHVLFGAQEGSYRTGESTLAREVLSRLTTEMLCIADRGFFGYGLWKHAGASGAELLWRVKKNLGLPCMERLSDGSYLSKVYPSDLDRRHDREGTVVRVIEYRLEGIEGAAEPLYRLITSIVDPSEAPGEELAALYHERWEIETAFDEFKTHLRGRRIVLRSKTPELVRQELYGLLLAHFALRGLMHEAALKADIDPDAVSFVHAVRVVRRKLPAYALFPPSAKKGIPSARSR